MTAVEVLKESPRSLPAQWVARRLKRPLVEVYVELVAAEGRGEVRVVVDGSNGQRLCEWETMQ